MCVCVCFCVCVPVYVCLCLCCVRSSALYAMLCFSWCLPSIALHCPSLLCSALLCFALLVVRVALLRLALLFSVFALPLAHSVALHCFALLCLTVTLPCYLVLLVIWFASPCFAMIFALPWQVFALRPFDVSASVSHCIALLWLHFQFFSSLRHCGPSCRKVGGFIGVLM